MTLASKLSRSRRTAVAIAAAFALIAGAATVRAALDPADLSTWLMPEASLYSVTTQGSNAWAAGYWGTIQRSTDGGVTWTHVKTPTPKTLFGISFADDKNGWAVGAGGTIIRSTDGGLTWVAQPVELTDDMGGAMPLDMNLFSVSAVSPTEAWAVGDLGMVLRTRDGEKWERISFDNVIYADDNVPERLLNAVVFTSPTDGWIAGEFATLLRTTDGGQTWTGTRQINGAPTDLYLFNLSGAAGGPAAAVGLAGSVLVSSEGGAIWESRSVDTSAGLFAIAWNGEHGVAVGDRGVVFVSKDGGQTWTDAKRPPLFNWLAGVTFAGPDAALIVGEAGVILRSTDGGATWVAAVTPGEKVDPPLSPMGGEPLSTPADVSPAPGVP
jgi:photosystem II stability/assembly factor-like uncharacterized protein